MANPNPIIPAANQLNLQLNTETEIDAVGPILGNPTYGQIVREHNRFVQIESAQSKGAGLNEDEFGGAIMRYQNVKTIRSSADLGINNAAILLQLEAIQTQITQGFARVEARMAADRARNYNNLYCVTAAHHGLNFRRVVKYDPGHPTPQPPAGVTRLDQPQQLVAFVPGGYPVGSNPPAGLVPRNFDELRAMSHFGYIDLRRALRGIYWFYNNNMLQLAPQAGLADTRALLADLEAFLTET